MLGARARAGSMQRSSDACGRLSLMDINSVRRYVGSEHGSYTFVVHATDREMLLRADSSNDESRWIRGLTLQTDLVHGGTFQGPPSAKNRYVVDERSHTGRPNRPPRLLLHIFHVLFFLFKLLVCPNP